MVSLSRHRSSQNFFSETFYARRFISRKLGPIKMRYGLTTGCHRNALHKLRCRVPPTTRTGFFHYVQKTGCRIVISVQPSSPACLRRFNVRLSTSGHLKLCIPRLFTRNCRTLASNSRTFCVMDRCCAPNYRHNLHCSSPDLGVR